MQQSLHAPSSSISPFISPLPHFLDCAWCNPTRPGATLAHHGALSMSQWGNYENMNFMTWNEKGHVVWIDMQRRWKWCNFLNSVIMVMCNGNAYLLSKISLSAWIVQLCAVSIFLERKFSLVECLKSNVKYVLIHLMTADGNTRGWMVLVWYCALFYPRWLCCVRALCPGPTEERQGEEKQGGLRRLTPLPTNTPPPCSLWGPSQRPHRVSGPLLYLINIHRLRWYPPVCIVRKEEPSFQSSLLCFFFFWATKVSMQTVFI